MRQEPDFLPSSDVTGLRRLHQKLSAIDVTGNDIAIATMKNEHPLRPDPMREQLKLLIGTLYARSSAHVAVYNQQSTCSSLPQIADAVSFESAVESSNS